MNAMMKKAGILLSVLGLIVGTSSCIMEERVVQFVISNGTCEEFLQYSETVTFSSTAVIDYANEIEQALLDNGVKQEDVRKNIVSAVLVSASYEVTDTTCWTTTCHDWNISGAITIARQDITEGPDTLIDYTNQSVSGALGKVIPAHLNRAGVDLMNKALEDFRLDLPGSNNPRLIVSVNNGSVSPAPSASDPIIFKWRACVVVHIVMSKDIDVPDPF